MPEQQLELYYQQRLCTVLLHEDAAPSEYLRLLLNLEDALQ